MSRNRESYRTDSFGMQRRGNRTSFFGVLCYILFMAITISLSVALMMAYITPLISPATFGSFTIVGIFTPILYIMLVVCMLVWIILQRRKTVLALFVVLLPGLFILSDFYNVAIRREPELPSDHRAFTVMSYNVRGFRGDNNQHTASTIVDSLIAEDRIPDIVCLQEFTLASPDVERLDSLFGNYNVNDVEEYGNVVLRTYSRYPIIAHGEISGDGRGTSQWCDVVVKQRDTVRVFNNHLYTMSITSEDSREIHEGSILRDGDRMISIVNRIADNSAVRAEHVDSLRVVMDATPYSKVVCGDFNDTPMSYVYRRISRGLYDSFVEAGRGYGYTFRPMHRTLRIDYILHSEDIETLRHHVEHDYAISDHLPVVARLKVLK